VNQRTIAERIQIALETLDLPTLVTRADIKKRYRQLAREHHPDRNDSGEDMEVINAAYALLMAYVDGFRYRFDTEEILQQYPEGNHAQKFRF